MRKHDVVHVFGALTLLLLSACKPADQTLQAAAQPGEKSESAPSEARLPAFVGKTWMSMDRGQPLGSILVFLPDRSLLMDSCFETFRIVEWGVVSADAIRWREDEIPIQAQWSQATPESLMLKVAGMDEARSYVLASVPYLCPEMPK